MKTEYNLFVLMYMLYIFNVQYLDAGDEFGRTDGANFTPHVITVNVGEVSHEEKVIQF